MVKRLPDTPKLVRPPRRPTMLAQGLFNGDLTRNLHNVLGDISFRANRTLGRDGEERMEGPLPLVELETADLPPAADFPGAVIFVTDAPAGEQVQYSDGTNWIPLAAADGIVTTFLGLTDTPGAYTGAAGDRVIVNTTEDALVFDPILYFTEDAAQISSITEKTTPVDADLLLIEDSADSNNKKRIQIGNLPAAGLIYVRDTAQASTSGTSIDFTKPASIFTVERITVLFEGVDTDAADDLLVQIGDAGGLETTGYLSAGTHNRDAGVSENGSTAGFVIHRVLSTDLFTGHMHIGQIDGETWISSHVGASSGDDDSYSGGGSKTLSASLDRLSIVPSGASSFEAGQINVIWEGTA